MSRTTTITETPSLPTHQHLHHPALLKNVAVIKKIKHSTTFFNNAFNVASVIVGVGIVIAMCMFGFRGWYHKRRKAKHQNQTESKSLYSPLFKDTY
jgi:hypothetical protein